jgi:hypothetical protein
MDVRKIVSGSVAGAALAWSAGAYATWDYESDQADAYEYVQFFCFGTEGTPAWTQCAATEFYLAALDFQDLGRYGSAGECFILSSLYWGSGGS